MLSAPFLGGLVGTGTGMADITPGSQGWRRLGSGVERCERRAIELSGPRSMLL